MLMKYRSRYVTPALLLAASLALATPAAFASVCATPLETAQQIESLTAGGLPDPTAAADAIEFVAQRDARTR
jgi:hypothetical protein